MQQKGSDGRRQATAREEQSRFTVRFVKPGPCNSIALAGPFFLKQLGQHLALLQGAHATQGLFRGGIAFLRNAQFEVKLRQRVVGRETVRLELRGKFEMINRRINFVAQGIGEAQKDVGLSKRWSQFGASGERNQRPSRITQLQQFHSSLEALDGFAREVQCRRDIAR